MAVRMSLPLYKQFKEIILARVEEGELAPGRRLESERKLAVRYGLSRLTVRRALSELVEEGRLFRKSTSGTFVGRGNGIEKGNKKGGKYISRKLRLKKLGVSFQDIYNLEHPYFTRLMKYITAHCLEKNIELQTYSFHKSDLYYRRKTPLAKAVMEKQLDGILIISKMAPEDVFCLRHSGIPFVWVNYEVLEENIPCVLVDYAHGAYLAVEHLLKLGHRRIAMITGAGPNRNSIFSITGYELAMYQAGLAVEAGMVRTGAFAEESGYRIMADILKQVSPPPTAVYISDEVMACGVLKKLPEAGYKVPGKISLVSCGNFLSPYATAVSLTTLDIKMEQMVQKALLLLEEIQQGRAGQKRFMFKPELIVRESTTLAKGR